jgi:hypothetical protein
MIQVMIAALEEKNKSLYTRINSGFIEDETLATLDQEVGYIKREASRLTALQSLPEDCEYAYREEDSARLLDRAGDALIGADANLARIKAAGLTLMYARQETTRRLQARF